MSDFTLNEAVHASTGLTPFFVNNARHPRVLFFLDWPVFLLRLGGGAQDGLVSTASSHIDLLTANLTLFGLARQLARDYPGCHRRRDLIGV